MTIYEDNNSVIAVSKSFKSHSKLKHIDIKHNFVKQVVRRNDIKIEYCPSEDNLADIFTKGLYSPNFLKIRKCIGLINFQNT